MRRVFWLLMVLAGWVLAADEVVLLTENGRANDRYSEYKGKPMLATAGVYRVTPAFALKGSEGKSEFSFAEGALTNGDSSYNYKRRPGPYVYWQGLHRGQVEFDLRKPYRIQRVRVNVLNSGPHGTQRIELFAKGDPLEFPELLKWGDLEPAKGWNEFAGLNRIAEGVRLLFTAQRGKGYITVSEVEIWGSPAPVGAVPKVARKVRGKAIREGDVEWYAFDFGPVSAPVFANFTGVPKDTVYTAKRGYGWVPYQDGAPMTPSNFGPESKSVPGLGERDRAQKQGAFGDGLYRDFVMTSEYYHTQVRQTFRLDVSNGPYRVVTFHGDQQYGRVGPQCWWIEAGGRRVVENLPMPRSRRAHAAFDVTAADGKLELTFDAAEPDPARRGFLLNGLVVLPTGTDARRAFAEAKAAKVHAALQREREELFKAMFVENPYVEEGQMPPVSAADQQRGYVPFVPHWMANVYPNSVPRPEDLKRPLSCFACPGEYEPLAVAVRALKDLDALACVVGELAGPGRLPAAAWDVHVVECWPQRLGSSWSTEWRVMPELLRAKPSVNVAKDTAQEFWLTVRVPADAKPGLYRGTVTLHAANAGATSLPVTVQVLPFQLRPNERPVGMYWREHKVAGTGMRDVQVRDMVEHGMTTLTMGRLFPDIGEVDGKLALDVAELRQFLQDLRRLGIQGPIPYFISGLRKQLVRRFPGRSDGDYDELYVEAIRQLDAVSSRPDTPKLLYYPVDEIGNHEKRGRKANSECALIARVPGATSYVTVNNYEAGERWGDTFDIWCGNIVYTAEQEAKLLARGKRYMRYGSAYLNDPRKTRTYTGFGFYRRPAEAMFYWHYQAVVGDAFDDFDGGSRDWCAAYPGPDDTLIPTTDWEGIREGVDDMRYIATLKHYAALAGNIPHGKPAAARALEALQQVLGGDDELRQNAFRDDLSHDAYHGLRRRLVDRILELREIVEAR